MRSNRCDTPKCKREFALTLPDKTKLCQVCWEKRCDEQDLQEVNQNDKVLHIGLSDKRGNNLLSDYINQATQ